MHGANKCTIAIDCLVFLILHLITFKYGTHYSVTYGGVEMRDLHRLIVEVFQSPVYVGWYVVCLILLGLHLKHGFFAAFNSLGFRHPRYSVCLKCIAWFYCLIVTAGFLSQPLYVYFIYRQ